MKTTAKTHLLFLLLISCFPYNSCVLVHECAPSNSRIGSVKITECFDDSTDVCTLKRNSSPTVTIQFTYLGSTNARFANVSVSAILPDAIVAPPTMFDGCALGVKCPLVQNKNYKFTAPMPVRTQYIPPFEVAFSYKMSDDLGPQFLCLYVSVTVGDKKPT